MAMSFKDWPLSIQVLVAVALGAALVVAGLYIPGSPVGKVRDDLDSATKQLKPLQDDVNRLQTYDRQRVELQGKMEALKKELDTLQTIVPEEKQVDDFLRMLQGAAVASNVNIRRLTAKPIVAKEYHYEMPFEIESDGPYYSVLDFFTRLSRLSRIINVGDLTLKGIPEGQAPKFRMTPGSTVTGTFMVTTFFTKSTEELVAAAKAGAKQK